MKFLLILAVTTFGGPLGAIPSTAIDTAFFTSLRACESAGITAARAIATLLGGSAAIGEFTGAAGGAATRWHCLPVEP